MVIRHILLKRENNIGSVVDIVSVRKVLSVFCIMFVLLIGCGEPNLDDPKVREKIIAEAIDEDNLQTRETPSGEELRYTLNQEKPYTGWVKTNWTLQQFQNGKPNGLYIEWYRSGQNEEKGTIRNGTKDGRWTYWYENGQKYEEGTYKDDKKEGLWTRWYKNGQKYEKGTYKDGKRDGKWTSWFENGQKTSEGTYKDGKADGFWTVWHENGQKESKGTWKNGKVDGVLTGWHENGQKAYEITVKSDGTESETSWDKKGEIIHRLIPLEEK